VSRPLRADYGCDERTLCRRSVDVGSRNREVLRGLRARLLVQEDRIEAVAESDRVEQSPLSPELVLVCPELRKFALQQLPERDPDCFLLRPRRERSAEDPSRAPVDSTSWDAREPAERQLRVRADEDTESSEEPPLLLSLLAYTVQQSVNMALHGVGVIAAISGLVVLMTQFHR
jgi:hypothetical protein